VVTKSADVNAPNLAPGTVLVAVNGEPLRVDPINERMKAYAYKLEMRVYAARKQVLDRRINDLLVVAEANKRKVGPEEIVRTEITDKLKPPTEAEVAKFYEDNKARIKGRFGRDTNRHRQLPPGAAAGEIGGRARRKITSRRQSTSAAERTRGAGDERESCKWRIPGRRQCGGDHS
jgi:hypothetical protein